MTADLKSSGSSGNASQSWSSSMGLRNRIPVPGSLGKKFSKTSRLVYTSKVWMNTIPTQDCDILMTFPAKTDDQVLMWLLSRLRTRTPELDVHVRHHSNTGVYGFYLTASYEHLLQGADEISMRKPLKKDYGGGMKEFVFEDQDYFEGVDDHNLFFTSQERQAVVKNMLFNLRAHDGDQLNKVKFLEGEAIVPLLMSKGVVQQVLPLHQTADLNYLRRNWVQAFFRTQPLEKIMEYFGVKIAMYFAYLGHYTGALTIPAFIGLIIWMLEGRNQFLDDILFVVFGFCNVIWATLYLEHWKRRSAEFAYQWGTLDREDELLVEPRPLFHGSLIKSAVTGRLEPYYPAWKRNLFRYFISLPIIIFCLSSVFVAMWCIFELQDWVNGKIKKGDWPFFCKFLPKILLALCIGIMDDIYKKVAYWLNDKENYRLQESYENNLIIKLVLFQFVNSFLSLFYIAFYLQDMDRLKEQLAALLITRQVIGNIKEALVPYAIGKLKLFKIGYAMAEGMTPSTVQKNIDELKEDHKKTDGDHPKEVADDKTVKGEETEEVSEKPEEHENGVAKMEEDHKKLKTETRKGPEGEMEITHSGPTLTQAEVEAGQKAYEDTFEDYLEMFIQFGYVTLFSSAFPMAAMCALVNNVIEIRSDAFKLCMTFQRPFGQRVENIGTWQDALELLSVIAVMVNCALIGMSDLAERLFPGWGMSNRIILIIMLEHGILALKLLVAYAIPDVPQWVAEEKARLEFLRREALKRISSTSGSESSSKTNLPPSSPGTVEQSDVTQSKTSPCQQSTASASNSSCRTRSILPTNTNSNNNGSPGAPLNPSTRATATKPVITTTGLTTFVAGPSPSTGSSQRPEEDGHTLTNPSCIKYGLPFTDKTAEARAKFFANDTTRMYQETKIE